jgi:hypothetical protein
MPKHFLHNIYKKQAIRHQKEPDRLFFYLYSGFLADQGYIA